jgi:hypothetical protein
MYLRCLLSLIYLETSLSLSLVNKFLKSIQVEPDKTGLSCSLAKNIIDQL